MVGWGQGTRSAAAVPLAACAEMLPPDARADDPLLQLRRTARTLREQAGGRPIVIGVDDAQRLDPASAALILQLATTGTAFVLATVRSSEPCPDAVQSLWKDAGAERVELQPLSEPGTSELIEAVLRGPAEQRVRQWIYDSSQGNVLYTRELVLAVPGQFRARGAGACRRWLEPHRAGDAVGGPGGAGPVQRGDRRSIRALRPDGRVTPVPGDAEARSEGSPRSPSRGGLKAEPRSLGPARKDECDVVRPSALHELGAKVLAGTVLAKRRVEVFDALQLATTQPGEHIPGSIPARVAGPSRVTP